MEKQPSAARIRRVDQLLTAEPSLKNLLGPKTVEVSFRNGENFSASPVSIKVASLLQQQGKDACLASRSEILNAAKVVLNLKPEAEKISSTSSTGIACLLMSVRELQDKDVVDGSEERKKIVDRLIQDYQKIMF